MMNDFRKGYVWQASRYWITDRPGPNERVGWNAVFVPHRIIKTTAKWFIAEHITSRTKIFLNREVLTAKGEIYHSTYHEYFYLNRPEYKQPGHEQRATQPPVARNDLTEIYRLFALSPNCTEKELKGAYRRLSRRAHPDVGGTHERFLEVQKNYYAIRAARGIR